MSTPREVLREALYDSARHTVDVQATVVLDYLSAAGFEVLPTALVDAVLNQEQRLMFTMDAIGALRVYREQVTP